MTFQTHDMKELAKFHFVARSASASEWKAVSSAILALVEDATFEVSSEGISFRAMDPSHVAMIDVSLPSSMFEKFECEKIDRFTVRVEDFAKLIKRSETKDSVEISRSDRESLLIKIGHDTYKREFELHLIDSDTKFSPVPKLSFDSKILLSTTCFSQALNDIAIISDHITIRSSKERVIFTGRGDTGRARATLVSKVAGGSKEGTGCIYSLEILGATGEEERVATYNAEYLLKFLKSVSPSIAESLTLQYASKMPLKLEISLGESVNRGGRIHFYLAPRVGTSAEE